MEKTNLLFQSLNEKLDNSLITLMKKVNEMINNSSNEASRKTKDFKRLFEDAKNEISSLVFSSNVDKNYLFNHLKSEIINFHLKETERKFTVKELLKDKELSSLVWEWRQFIEWYQDKIIHSKIDELDNHVSVKTSEGNNEVWHLTPSCGKPCQNDFILNLNNLCSICPIKLDIENRLLAFQEKYSFITNKEDYLKKTIIESDSRIDNLFNEKSKGKKGLNLKNWNSVFLNWTSVKEFCQEELNNFNPNNEVIDYSLPDLELKTIKEQIRLMNDLGIIQFLKEKYPNTLNRSNNEFARLIAMIIKEKQGTIQPTLNALINDNSQNKNYPKESQNTKAIIDRLNSNESK